jgi:hypothetical protein
MPPHQYGRIPVRDPLTVSLVVREGRVRSPLKVAEMHRRRRPLHHLRRLHGSALADMLQSPRSGLRHDKRGRKERGRDPHVEPSERGRLVSGVQLTLHSKQA